MKFLEKAANIAVIVGVVVFITVVVTDKLAPHATKPALSDPARQLLGKTISLPGTQLSQSRNSLVLVLSTACHFCKASLPFYKELASKSLGRVDVVAVLPQPLSEAQDYIQQAAVPATRVVSADLATIGVSGTPTVLLLDRTGKVQDVWVGQLDESRQKQVLSRVLL
jgi:thiol-disulfide isomerase/thioredoxin